MGREISASHFHHSDFHQFDRHMTREMALLHEYFRTERFSMADPCIGVELEMWLIDQNGNPQPRNGELLQLLNSPDVVPELAQFNIEFNVPHQQLMGESLQLLEDDLGSIWNETAAVAGSLGLSVLAIGVLPTIEASQLTLATMSEMSRFRALNEQVRRLRRGRPIHLRIQGEEELDVLQNDVMLEAAATSLQVHYQVPWTRAVRYYNAAVIASGPVLALSANSPFLFGRHLWQESRIPLFETAIDLGGPFPRVHFGSGYALASLEEFFLENRSCHAVLLPIELEEPSEMLPHVRLHNGTIWRWNRPLIGFDDNGQPHIRIEHRVMPAGPSLLDMMSNIAFATGLIRSLSEMDIPPESLLPFAQAEANFHSAARFGLASRQIWLNGETFDVRPLIEQLLPSARRGLEMLNISPSAINRYLSVIEARIQTGQNGAVWQSRFVEQHGKDFSALTRTYAARQRTGQPVHEWELMPCV